MTFHAKAKSLGRNDLTKNIPPRGNQQPLDGMTQYENTNKQ